MRLTKESRQRATAAMTKCDCGNVARLNSTQCGACEDADNYHETKVQALYDCASVDDLKEFIAEYLMNNQE